MLNRIYREAEVLSANRCKGWHAGTVTAKDAYIGNKSSKQGSPKADGTSALHVMPDDDHYDRKIKK